MHSVGFCSLWPAPSPFPPVMSCHVTCQKLQILFSLPKSVRPIQQQHFSFPETYYVTYLSCKLRSDANVGKMKITRLFINTRCRGKSPLSHAVIQIMHLDTDYMITADVNWFSDLTSIGV